MPHYNNIIQYVTEFLNGKQFAYVPNRWQVLRMKVDSAHLNSYTNVLALEHHPCLYNQTYNPEQTLHHERNFRYNQMHISSNYPITSNLQINANFIKFDKNNKQLKKKYDK